MHTISTAQDLLQLQEQLRKFSIIKFLPEYNIQLPGFTAAENTGATAYLNSLGKECGCTSGSFVMSMGFVAATAYYFITGGSFSAIGWPQIITLASVTVVTAIAGKLYGLFRARLKMIKYAGSLLEKAAQCLRII